MPEQIEGACLCGAVTFEIAPPYRWFAHCHCSLCRKRHGTLFATGLGVHHDRFRWRSGADDIVHYRASEAFERPFCRRCGSKVPARSHDPDFWHVPAGLLAGDLGAQPRTHIFVTSKSSLHTIADSLPQHAAYPPGIALPAVDAPARPATGPGASGSCACGAVAFDVTTAPRRLVHCHCSLCRRSRGTAFATTMLAPSNGFRWRRGREHVQSYALPAPHRYGNDFCAACGTLLPTLWRGAPQVLLPAGCIDTALEALPAVHIYVGSKAPWDEITDAWPQFAELPPPERLTELFR